MRFLANENFPFDAVEALRQNGHNVTWIRTDFSVIVDRIEQIEEFTIE